MKDSELSADLLRELFYYDPDTGDFRHKKIRQGAKHEEVAGRDNGRGYITIKIYGRDYRAHRLAWLYVYGEWPSTDLDHINGKRSDNRIANLRPATRSQNAMNRKKSTLNTSGARGVVWSRAEKKWRAQIVVGKKFKSLGYFESVEDAKCAYDKAASEMFGEFTRLTEAI